MSIKENSAVFVGMQNNYEKLYKTMGKVFNVKSDSNLLQDLGKVGFLMLDSQLLYVKAFENGENVEIINEEKRKLAMALGLEDKYVVQSSSEVFDFDTCYKSMDATWSGMDELLSDVNNSFIYEDLVGIAKGFIDTQSTFVSLECPDETLKNNFKNELNTRKERIVRTSVSGYSR